MDASLPFGPQLPISADDALKLAQGGQEMLRKDFYSAAFIIMGLAILGLVGWVMWLQQKLFSAAVHIDRNTEAMELLLVEIRSKGRGRNSAPRLPPEPQSRGGA